jgi:5'(3')-deoxyribonucleotidase
LPGVLALMGGKRVLVDVDEVLADFCTPAFAFMRQRFGLQLDHTTLKHWDLYLALSKEQLAIFEVDFFGEGRCASLELLPGAVEAVEAMRQQAEVVAVTRPPRNGQHWMHERNQWLIEKLGFDYDTIIQTKAKHMIGADMLIDDSPENVVRWRQSHPRGTGLLWALPSTEQHRECDDFRVRSWTEVLERLNAL